MSVKEDLVGRRFGKLVVVEEAKRIKGERTRWVCRCDCGVVKIVRAKHLDINRTKSCGCSNANVKENLLGKRFNKLLVIGEAAYEKNKRVKWLCRCDCGSIRTISATHLKGGDTVSCGCVRSESQVEDLLGKRFGRLVVIERAKPSRTERVQWLCRCDCGNTKVIKAIYLTTDQTKSCGCLHKEKASLNVQRAVELNTKYDPKISSARRIWKEMYKAEISFDEFYQLSQTDCFYCGAQPSNKSNNFRKTRGSRQISIDNGTFIYNGLDRIDSSKTHTIDNVVACCIICNMAKRENSLPMFKKHIKRLISNVRIDPKDYREESELLECNYVSQKGKHSPDAYRSTVNATFKRYKKYDENNLTIKTFYQLCQMNCFYCNLPPSNESNREKDTSKKFHLMKGLLKYSGLDRINNDLPHNYDNVVPCCKFCNFAKSSMTLGQFYEWIDRLAQKEKERDFNPAL